MRSSRVFDDRHDAEPRRFHSAQDGVWYVQIMQGDFYVTGNPEETLTTILGSCIAACIRDPVAGIGGMNHFLLPESGGEDRHAQRFGVNAMEMLINGILKRGGARERLEAKLFGGASVISALSDVGARNAEFALQYLEDEGIAVAGGDVGGISPRRIQYWPVTGRARRLAVRVDREALIESERSAARTDTAPADDLELF